MPLETANFIPEMIASNPAGTDQKAIGDDHLRLLKRSVLGSFPGFVGTTATPKSVTLTEDQVNDAALKSEAGTITGDWVLANLIALLGRNFANDDSAELLQLDDADIAVFGDSQYNARMRALDAIEMVVAGSISAHVQPPDAGGLLVVDRNDLLNKVGFRSPREREMQTADVPTQDDEGMILRSDTINVNSVTLNQLEQYTTMTLASSLTGFQLLAGAGVTLEHHDGRDSVAPGTPLTIARSSVVQLQWRTSSRVTVWGNGIS